MRLNKKSKKSGIGKFFLSLLAIIVLAGGAYIALVFFENSPPSLQLNGDTGYIGKTAHLSVTAGDDNSGLRSVKVFLRQEDKEHVLIQQFFPREGYSGRIGPASFSEDTTVDIGGAGFSDGSAELVAQAVDYSLRGYLSGNNTEVIKQVTIDTVAPKVLILHSEKYIQSGGSGIVIYRTDADAVRHGASFGGKFHAGHPVGDGRDDVFISYIALPYDAEKTGEAMIQAEDAAGNQANQPFSPIFQRKQLKRDRINISDGFLSSKIPEFETHYPEMQGNMKEKYLYTNREVRQANNEKISQLCGNPISEPLWEGGFQRMAGAARAGFADHRTYFYEGEEIDRQVHLGMDIASTQHAEVRAANHGEVVYADYLGIYGNMVLLDHGQGVFSLYSHLSSIQVAEGERVSSGDTLGLTGTSGMAGGDHLHFSMLINGVFVTPLEWWDARWIEATITEPLLGSKF